MTQSRRQVDELFAQAIVLPPDARAEFLASACGADRDLRAEVESLLDHDARAIADFMRLPERPPFVPPYQGGIEGGSDPLIGKRIGMYTLRRVIAGGGMSIVYEGEQDNPRRIVALKVVRSWAWSRMGLRRFEFEVQALARLTHPNIAQIYDADVIHGLGAADGTPYFVMEFISDAQTIIDYANERDLDLRQKCDLLLQLCEAVHYGHQKGIIHRDLKPANILVTPPLNPPLAKRGLGGVVKVIDFGIAKAVDSNAADITSQTETGQLIGTLQYMSPEQCAADPLALDVRSDVYSLGVVAYQLLCGRLPYSIPLAEMGPTTALRAICETPPIRPSTVNRALRGDLEIILLKALEKDREKRYQSALDLARDLRHYLARQPIEARGPSLASSAFLWTRRHPILTTAIAAATVGITILATVVATVWVAHLQPYRIELRNDNREAVLLSFSGKVLFAWTTEIQGAITVAELIDGFDGGAGKFVILGFSEIDQGPFRGSLCAFDANKPSFNNPIWQSKITSEDVPKNDRPGFAAENFGVGFLWRHNVFPDDPGKELIVAFQHTFSRRAIRVVTIKGTTLYQVWHDGLISAVNWLPGAGLLILTGQNDEVDWEQRDHSEAAAAKGRSPLVVFAVNAGQRFVSNEYLSTGSDDERLRPVWYKCLWPPRASDFFALPRILQQIDLVEYDDGLHVEVCAEYKDSIGADGSWILDSSGKSIPGAHVRTDAYHRASQLPPVESFHFADLPPVRYPGKESPN